jgi:acetyl-CoA carboxylase beta subunit
MSELVPFDFTLNDRFNKLSQEIDKTKLNKNDKSVNSNEKIKSKNKKNQKKSIENMENFMMINDAILKMNQSYNDMIVSLEQKNLK